MEFVHLTEDSHPADRERLRSSFVWCGERFTSKGVRAICLSPRDLRGVRGLCGVVQHNSGPFNNPIGGGLSSRFTREASMVETRS